MINGPTIDHIYLFRSVEEVLDMVEQAGFKIQDYICATEGNASMEKAIKKKMTIDIAMLLKKC